MKADLNERKKQFEAEKKISTLLMESPKPLRRKLYSIEYDKFFKNFPNHSSVSLVDKKNNVNQELMIVKKIMKEDSTIMEIGAGDSLFARKVCEHFKNVIAIDVSGENNKAEFPKNYKQIICDGIELPVETRSVDFIFSNQVAEHLHPEDLVDQTRSIYNCLKPGGIYEVVTPHRFIGPHDVSRYFSNKAEGLHLKEYTIYEIYEILKNTGFKKIALILKIRDIVVLIPIQIALLGEMLLQFVSPLKIGRKLLNKMPFRQFLFMRLVGYK